MDQCIFSSSRLVAPTLENAYWSVLSSRLGGVGPRAFLPRAKGFRGGPFLDDVGTTQLLFSSHLRERDKMLLRSISSGGTWNGFLLG